MPLKGRLGLDTAKVPQADRHGLMWLERGKLSVSNGNLIFTTAGTDKLKAGKYDIPFQRISNILLGPGTTVSHDALRILAKQDTGLLAVGSGGVRVYAASMPFGPDRSALARQQARFWSDEKKRIDIVRKMYAIRLGEQLPSYVRDIDTMRGIEGQRVNNMYKRLAEQYGISWKGRRFDRNNPDKNDPPNQAINHAVTATYAAGRVAVSVMGALPQLGFIHESSGHAFVLDIADLFRSSFAVPVAFEAVSNKNNKLKGDIEHKTRELAGRKLQKENIIPEMIDRIKELLEVDDDSSNAQSSG